MEAPKLVHKLWLDFRSADYYTDGIINRAVMQFIY